MTTATTPTGVASAELAGKTPSEIVRYFDMEDEINISDDVGTTVSRVIAAVLTVGFFSLTYPIGALLVNIISQNGYAHMFGGLALWLTTMAIIIPQLIVSVPEITGLITVNLLANGKLRSYSTGFQIKYLWEQAKQGNFINLRLIPTSNTLTFVTSDGVEVSYTYTIQYRGRLKLLGIFIRVALGDVNEALGAIARYVISQGVMGKKADELRSDTEVKKLQEKLNDELGQTSRFGHQIEYRYGIDIEVVSLSEPKFSKDYIESTTTQVIVDKMNAAGKKLMDKVNGLGLTGQSAADMVAMLNKEAVTKTVTGFEATELADRISAGMTDTAKAIASVIVGKKE